ncbi:MAG: bifunctional riboflavin kinase/FAD synthetase [Turneriella sp.]|nr:bifunctional riboflavin kinase/FAD synthetase [Turneriella sp.]
MNIISDLNSLPAITHGSVVVMGDFDGVHSGHAALIAETVARAQAASLDAVLVTYEPSPKKILKKLKHDSRLTTFDEKKALLGGTGLTTAVFYPVTAATLKISARTFLRDFLLARLKMRCLVMGGDHHFGHNRRGNARYLAAAQQRYGFELKIVDEQITDGQRTSSSRMRAALSEGDTETVSRILGRPYSVAGEVLHGERRGSQLGFPTANIALDPEKLLPLTGVYSGTVVLPGGQRVAAVANLGHKPTAGEFPLGLEVHLLDFSGDLYGKTLLFEFNRRIRGEQKFDGLDALKARIAQDVHLAREHASGAKKMSYF